MWLSGYAGRTKPAEGKVHDLWAKALVIEDPHGRRAVIVTTDLVGIDYRLARDVCEYLRKKHGLPREAILLSVSHTHSGPVVRGNLDAMYGLDEQQTRLIHDYAETLRARLVDVVRQAVEDLRPARLGWAVGHASFAVNRRNNKEADVPRLREEGRLVGPVDHDVPVLTVRDLRGSLRAVLFGYACHATVLNGYQWCGDYPGFAQAELEKAHPGAVALFWAGCGADQNPLPRRSVALAARYGAELADSVEKVLRGAVTPLEGRLGLAYAEVDVPFSELPTREKIVADSLSKDVYVAARARLLLKQMEQNGGLRGTYPYPVQVWQLGGGLTFVALGGEVVVDYAIRLKKELGPGRTWVAGYANDVMAYIPSLRVLKEGGYEGAGAMVFYALPTTWGPRVEEVIVAAVHEQAKRAAADGAGKGKRAVP
jgi:hypothetical protein